MKPLTLAAILVFLTSLFPLTVKADVQIKESYQTSGFMGIGATTGKTVQKIKGSDSLVDSSQNLSGSMMSLIGGAPKGPQRKIDLIRLGERKRWILNPQNRTYVEAPLASKPPSSPQMSQIPVHLKETSFKMAPSKTQKIIHGFKTRLYNATFTMKLENTQNKQMSTFRVKMKLWVAPWTPLLRKAHREIEAFNSQYVKAAGVGSTGIGAQLQGLEMLKSITHYNGATGTALTKGITEFRKKMSKLPGFLIKMNSDWYLSLPKARGQSATQGLDLSKLSGNMPAATQNLLKGLLQASNPDGSQPMMSMKTVVSEIKVSALPKKDFEIPAGYQKK